MVNLVPSYLYRSSICVQLCIVPPLLDQCGSEGPFGMDGFSPRMAFASFIDVLVVSYVCKDSSLQMFCLVDYVGWGRYFSSFSWSHRFLLLPPSREEFSLPAATNIGQVFPPWIELLLPSVRDNVEPFCGTAFVVAGVCLRQVCAATWTDEHQENARLCLVAKRMRKVL